MNGGSGHSEAPHGYLDPWGGGEVVISQTSAPSYSDTLSAQGSSKVGALTRWLLQG